MGFGSWVEEEEELALPLSSPSRLSEKAPGQRPARRRAGAGGTSLDREPRRDLSPGEDSSRAPGAGCLCAEPTGSGALEVGGVARVGSAELSGSSGLGHGGCRVLGEGRAELSDAGGSRVG